MVASCALWGEGKPHACAPAPKGWEIYLDRSHGFCFQYPSIYRSVHNEYDKQGTVTLQRLRSDGKIYIFFEDKPFELKRLENYGSTGIDSPPEPRQEGQNHFYYYGPGGGGVSYADRFFYNLEGKTLYITFDGPYPDNDKSPTTETKQYERKILESFRTF
jgi:hypothetical protein